jgi:hypothetical protein
MRFRNGERPPPRSTDDGLSNELPAKALDDGFSGGNARSQDAGLISPARLRLLTRQIYRLGERPLYELFRELDAGAPLQPRLEAYARLEPLADFIAALDGDQLPPPARLVRGRAP